MFETLEKSVLPILAESALERCETKIECWTIGCASGEEPYTLAMIWDFRLQIRFPGLDLQVLATEADRQLIDRAQEGRYPWSSVKDLPENWRDRAFARDGDEYCLHPEHKSRVRFLHQDVRAEAPEGPFDLVLCRNLVYTYFDDEVQGTSLGRIGPHLRPGGALVIGSRESLPPCCHGFLAWAGTRGIHHRVS